MKIHISEATKVLLPENKYCVIERGKIEVKGKGVMKTYFILNKKSTNGEDMICPFMSLCDEYKKIDLNLPDDYIVQDDKHAGFFPSKFRSFITVLYIVK